MKRLFLWTAAFLLLLLWGCRADPSADISAYQEEIGKAQEILVMAPDTGETLKTITEKEDIDAFVEALKLEQWTLQAIPKEAEKIGAFRLSQETTVHFGQTSAGQTMQEICTLTLYSGSRVDLEFLGIHLNFSIGLDPGEYLTSYFE
jgi:hypothetical protein